MKNYGGWTPKKRLTVKVEKQHGNILKVFFYSCCVDLEKQVWNEWFPAQIHSSTNTDSTNPLQHKHTSAQTFQHKHTSAQTLQHKHTSAQTLQHKHTSAQTHVSTSHTSSQTHVITNTRHHKHTSSQTHISTNTRHHKHTSSQTHSSTNTRHHKQTSSQTHARTNTHQHNLLKRIKIFPACGGNITKKKALNKKAIYQKQRRPLKHKRQYNIQINKK